MSDYHYGVDVAKWQGTIDWTKVASSGKEFALLKVIDKSLKKEGSFNWNYVGAEDADLEIGCYTYVYAKTKEEALKVGNKILDIANEYAAQYGIKVSEVFPCGVWIDMEDSSIKKLGKTNLTNIINNIAFPLRLNGIKVGVYCNKDWYNNVLDKNALCNTFKYPFWIARYPANDSGIVKESLNPQNYQNVVAWQYSSKGKVNGISGNVDMDLSYYKLSDVMKFY